MIVAGLAGLVTLDVVPRHLAGARQVSACGLEDLDVRIASAPISWQLATGGLQGEVRLPAETVDALLTDRLQDSPLVDPRTTLVDGAVRIDAELASPFGKLPVEADIEPTIGDDGLSMHLGGVRVAGNPLPAALLQRSGIAEGIGGGNGAGPCSATGDGSAQARLTGVKVEAEGLVLKVEV